MFTFSTVKPSNLLSSRCQRLFCWSEVMSKLWQCSVTTDEPFPLCWLIFAVFFKYGNEEKAIYEVWQFNSRNSRNVSLGCWVKQTRVLKHVWTCSNWRLQEPQTKWVICSRAAEEVLCVCGIRLAEKWVTRIWSSG